MTYKKRVDSNTAILDAAFQAIGCHTLHTERLGHGFPDRLIVSRCGHIGLVEYKTAKGKLTPDECEFFRTFTGPLTIIREPEQAAAFAAYLDGEE